MKSFYLITSPCMIIILSMHDYNFIQVSELTDLNYISYHFSLLNPFYAYVMYCYLFLGKVNLVQILGQLKVALVGVHLVSWMFVHI